MTTLTASAPVFDARGGLPRAYHVRTLGCQINVYDSEHMAGPPERAGYLRVEDVPETASHVTNAGDGGTDIIVINTYSVHEDAAIRLFGDLSQLAVIRRERPSMRIVVAGYLTRQMGEGVVERAPWVDVVFGTHNLDVLPTLLERARHNFATAVKLEESFKAFLSTLPTRRKSSYAARVSIAVGCNNTRTFCIVPPLRGKQRDRRPGDVLAEVEAVATQDTIEVTLLGRNVNSYGVGFRDRGAFAKLLRAAGPVGSTERVRSTSPHPAAFADDIIEAVATTETVMPSLCMSLQSGSDRILRAMRRSCRTQRFLGALNKVRAVIPEAVITTDTIVGFPGETEEGFQATLDTVEQARFASAYTFECSPRSGTPAADRGGQVLTKIVKDRYRRSDVLVRRITHEENKRQERRVVEVLVAEGEGRRDVVTTRIFGRAADSYLVHVALSEGLVEDDYVGGAPCPGDMVTVHVTHGTPHNLIADSVHCGRELNPRTAAANEALKPDDRFWLDSGPVLFQVWRTRAGGAWERRRAEAYAIPEPDTAPVSLGLPTMRMGVPI